MEASAPPEDGAGDELAGDVPFQPGGYAGSGPFASSKISTGQSCASHALWYAGPADFALRRIAFEPSSSPFRAQQPPGSPLAQPAMPPKQTSAAAPKRKASPAPAPAPAAAAPPKIYVVRTSFGYPPDGFHSYSPPDTKVIGAFATVALANACSEDVFLRNPWGLGAGEMRARNKVDKTTGLVRKRHAGGDGSEDWVVTAEEVAVLAEWVPKGGKKGEGHGAKKAKYDESDGEGGSGSGGSGSGDGEYGSGSDGGWGFGFGSAY